MADISIARSAAYSVAIFRLYKPRGERLSGGRSNDGWFEFYGVALKSGMSKRAERNLNYSTYLYIIYALVFLAMCYTHRVLSTSRIGNASRGKSTPAFWVRAKGGKGEGGRTMQFKLSWIILAISDLYGSENATVFPRPITTRFPPPGVMASFNAPPIYTIIRRNFTNDVRI